MTEGLSRGAHGEDVRALQVWLTLHYGARLTATGDYCALTYSAVRRLQAAHGIEPTGTLCARTVAVVAAQEAAYQARLARAPGDVLPLGLGRAPKPEEAPCSGA